MSALPREIIKNLRVIAFDADDTLWDCQSHFEAVENHLYQLIDLGYGCKAFTISIIETAFRVGGDHLSAEQLSDLLSHSKSLLHLPATPLPEVEQTLQRLQAYPYRLVVFTKGELQDQENKLKRSGLGKYFSYVEITSDKTEVEFQQLCEHLGILPENLLMVGNSLKSDIAPSGLRPSISPSTSPGSWNTSKISSTLALSKSPISTKFLIY